MGQNNKVISVRGSVKSGNSHDKVGSQACMYKHINRGKSTSLYTFMGHMKPGKSKQYCRNLIMHIYKRMNEANQQDDPHIGAISVEKANSKV